MAGDRAASAEVSAAGTTPRWPSPSRALVHHQVLASVEASVAASTTEEASEEVAQDQGSEVEVATAAVVEWAIRTAPTEHHLDHGREAADEEEVTAMRTTSLSHLEEVDTVIATETTTAAKSDLTMAVVAMTNRASGGGTRNPATAHHRRPCHHGRSNRCWHAISLIVRDMVSYGKTPHLLNYIPRVSILTSPAHRSNST